MSTEDRPTGAGLAERIKSIALGLGFDTVGIAPALPTREGGKLREWLARGYAGEMGWLERRVEEREDPRRLFEGARSVIVTGLVYEPDPADHATTGTTDATATLARVARYAGGDDYHEVLRERLDALASALEALCTDPVRTRAYVDTGPVLERVYAAHAGLGWVGRNTLLIHPGLGSYLFLGVLLTDLELPPDIPEPDHCGSCRACLDACPTEAFPEPYVMDARRCLSYTTIELRGSIPDDLRSPQGDRVFGCDVCQEVCPWNTRTKRSIPPDTAGLRERLAPRPEWRQPALEWILGLEEDAWRAVTRRSSLRRSKWRGLLRNALVAAGNSGDRALVPAVQRHAEGDDALLAEHARWALSRLEVSPAS